MCYSVTCFSITVGTSTSSNSVQLPDGPFNPTNYSGTQVNFWGVAPGQVPGIGGSGGYSVPGMYNGPYPDRPSQLGYVTEQTIRVNTVDKTA